MANYICPTHKIEFVLRPAGVSKKTGRPYEAFWACPTYGCREKPLGDAKHEVYQEAQSDQISINGDKFKQDQVDKDLRIQRQHSQEMAIRFLELKYKYDSPAKDSKLDLAEKVRYMTDWFMKDLIGESAQETNDSEE